MTEYFQKSRLENTLFWPRNTDHKIEHLQGEIVKCSDGKSEKVLCWEMGTAVWIWISWLIMLAKQS